MDPDMTNNELIGLAEREAQRLNEENDHSAATLMRQLCERLRGNYTIYVDATGVDQQKALRLNGLILEIMADTGKCPISVIR